MRRSLHNINHPLFARLCACALVRHSFNASAACREVIPRTPRGLPISLKYAQKRGTEMANHPLVLKEIARIMDYKERNAQKFFAMQWDWAEALDAAVKSGKAPEKHVLEAGKLAVANLAKGYVGEGADTSSTRPSQVAPDPRLSNLIGKPKLKDGETPLLVDPTDTVN